MDKIFARIASLFFTPIYVTFFLVSLSVHWKFWVTLFILSDDHIHQVYPGVSRLDLLQKQLWDSSNLEWSILGWLISIVGTVFFIWIFPQLIGIRAFKRAQLDKSAMEMVRLEVELKQQDEKEQILKKKVNIIKLEQNVVAEEVKLEDTQESRWKKEFDDVSNNTELFRQMPSLTSSIYEHYGLIRGDNFRVNTDFLAYLDSAGLITIDQQDERIFLTDKGKFFIKLYQTLNKG